MRFENAVDEEILCATARGDQDRGAEGGGTACFSTAGEPTEASSAVLGQGISRAL